MEHDVYFDRAGWGNYPRLTCQTCFATIVKQQWMSRQDWLVVVKEFEQNHPSKVVSDYISVVGSS